MTESPSDLKSEYASNEVTSQESTPLPKQQMEENLKMLMHACQCDDSGCKLVACKKMKIHVNHTKACEYQTSGGCAHCRTLFLLCSYHAKVCKQVNCTVIDCTRIKEKMQQRRVISDVVPELIASLSAASNKESEMKCKEQKVRLIEQTIACLLHPIQCRDPDCSIPSCAEKKVSIAHSKTCEQTSGEGNQIGMDFYDSKNCQNDKCAIPFFSKLNLRRISERQIQNDIEPSSGTSLVQSSKVEISPQARKNSVSMLVMTMCPTADLNAIDRNTSDLFTCGQKLEEGIFEVANTNSEYQKMLIEMVKNVSDADFSAKTD